MPDQQNPNAAEIMFLTERPNCFACKSLNKKTIWDTGPFQLVACSECGSEWAEGLVQGEQAYTYANYNNDSAYQHYSQTRATRFMTYLKKFFDKPGRLLDVGCGTGEFIKVAKDAGWDAIGVELTKKAATLAHKNTRVKVIAGDIVKDDLFPPSHFDLVSLWGVIEHVPDPTTLIQACASLLHPNGFILLETPNAKALFRRIAQKLMSITQGKFERPFKEILGAGHVVWYSTKGLMTTCCTLGLETKDIRGSRNSTRFLLRRFSNLPLPKRLLFQTMTILLNQSATPIGYPNQLLACIQYDPEKSTFPSLGTNSGGRL